MPAVCGEFSPPLYLPAPEFPLIDGETISAQIQSEMNLGFIKRKASYKEGEKKVPQTWRDKLSYNGFSPVSLQSLSCIRAWGLWWLGVILQCVGRVWMCQGYQGRHPFVKSSRWQRLEKKNDCVGGFSQEPKFRMNTKKLNTGNVNVFTVSPNQTSQ